MKKSYRVKSDKDFQAIFQQGQHVANRQFVLYYLDQDRGHLRLGLSVSKKLGNAVVRNRIKKRLRHLVLEFLPQMAKKDVVIIARKGVEELPYSQMRKNLQHVLKLADLYHKEETSETIPET